MAAIDYRQDYCWRNYTPIDNTGVMRSVFKSSYKNLRYLLTLQEQFRLTEAQAYNLPGLSFAYYGVTDFWRVLLGFNGLVDPIQDVYAGMMFRFPTQDSIIQWLNGQPFNRTEVMVL